MQPQSTPETIEEWRAIPGYEGFYEVSNLGRVKSLARITFSKIGHRCTWPERILRASADRLGYSRVSLCVNGKPRSIQVHRLVALAFLGLPPQGKQEVNHKDSKPPNNRLENLEWCSHQENQQHMTNAGHCMLPRNSKGEANGHAKLTEANIKEIRELAHYLTQQAIADRFGIKQAHVSGILLRKNWKHVI